MTKQDEILFKLSDLQDRLDYRPRKNKFRFPRFSVMEILRRSIMLSTIALEITIIYWILK